MLVNRFKHKHRLKGIIYIETYVLDVLLSSHPTSASGVLDISPEKDPYGLSYEDHIMSFWRWIISLPKENNPWEDTKGDICTCAQGSVSPVFYLSGNGGGSSKRKNDVPLGKGLLIPLMVVEVSEKDFDDKTPQKEKLRQIANNDQKSVTELYLKIDDRVYDPNDLRKYRRSTGAFSVTFPDNGIFGATSGIVKAVADGYYIITTPLPKGTHTVHYRSSLECKGNDCLEKKPFHQDIECTINP
jgi:hypothetical protein